MASNLISAAVGTSRLARRGMVGIAVGCAEAGVGGGIADSGVGDGTVVAVAVGSGVSVGSGATVAVAVAVGEAISARSGVLSSNARTR